MSRILAVLFTMLPLLLAPGGALAARMALVIGNADYARDGALANPLRDAEAFASFLEGSGFAVTLVKDATRAQMSSAIVRFSDGLKADDTALFYYAGHGMQMDGENYLIGVEAQLQSAFDVPGEAIGLTALIDLLESRAALSMIFIDACRNNPLAENLTRQATRGITRGLAPIKAEGDGTMVAFAATPGQEAFDGLGENSPFTTALIEHLGEPGLEVGTAFKRVIRDVRAATLNKQSPQIVSSVAAEFYFGGDAVATVAATKPEPISIPLAVPVEPTATPAVQGAEILKLAEAHFSGIGAPLDKAKAANLFAVAADAGEPQAMVALGKMYATGDGVDKNPQQAVRLYSSAADEGDPRAIRLLALAYHDGMGVPRDYVEAARLARRAAEAGDTRAMRILTTLYDTGHGVPEDVAQSAQWALRAAEAGDSGAMVTTGMSYVLGTGVAMDIEKGIVWLERASEAGNRAGDALLGHMLLNGVWGLPEEPARGLEMVKRAAGAHDPDGMAALGYAMLNGREVPVDRPGGLAMLKDAFAKGSNLAALHLLITHFNGDGKGVDNIEQDADAAAGYSATGMLRGMSSVLDAFEGDLDGDPFMRQFFKAIQSRLAAAGFYSGPLDGLVGPATRKAIADARGTDFSFRDYYD